MLAIIFILSENVCMVELPQVTLGIKIHAGIEIGNRIGKRLVQLDDTAGRNIQLINTITFRAYQDVVLLILHQLAHSYFLRPIRYWYQLKAIVAVRVAIQSVVGSHIQAFLVIRQESHDAIVLNRRGVIGVTQIACKGVTIKPVQAIIGSYPDKSILILHNDLNLITRQLVGSIESARVGIRQRCKHLHQDHKNKYQ